MTAKTAAKLVLTTRKRCVNPLLGNCSSPHWLGKPTSDRKALQQTPHPSDSDCRNWKADDSEPKTPTHQALYEALRAFKEAAQSWHDFHHGDSIVRCDDICKALPKARAALALADAAQGEK